MPSATTFHNLDGSPRMYTYDDAGVDTLLSNIGRDRRSNYSSFSCSAKGANYISAKSHRRYTKALWNAFHAGAYDFRYPPKETQFSTQRRRGQTGADACLRYDPALPAYVDSGGDLRACTMKHQNGFTLLQCADNYERRSFAQMFLPDEPGARRSRRVKGLPSEVNVARGEVWEPVSSEPEEPAPPEIEEPEPLEEPEEPAPPEIEEPEEESEERHASQSFVSDFDSDCDDAADPYAKRTKFEVDPVEEVEAKLAAAQRELAVLRAENASLRRRGGAVETGGDIMTHFRALFADSRFKHAVSLHVHPDKIKDKDAEYQRAANAVYPLLT